MKINHVLNIEDTMLKHIAIARALKKCGVEIIDLAITAEEGLEFIDIAIKENQAYDLLVIDMHFQAKGKDDTKAGLYVIDELKRKRIDIPIVICSSLRYRIDEIAGCIFYNERSQDIDSDIREMLKTIETK